jgi:hypothetical protein
MAHVIFALFDGPSEVAAAVAELEEAGTPKRHCSVVVHRGGLENLPASELELFESGAAAMTARLVALGAAVGAVVGLVAGPLGLLAAGPLASVLLTTTAGTMAGALSGVLAGASDSDPTLHRLSEGLEKGQVLLSVEPPSLDCAERAEHILHKHHARVVHRHLLRPMTGEERREVDNPKAP